MKVTRRAERRHHKARLRRKRQDVVAHWKASNIRARGVAVDTPTGVSGYREKGPSARDLRNAEWHHALVASGDAMFIQGSRIVSL